ncbi:MAG TPA: tetratricopeptide repeat protein [Allosphingosinicella sp.]|nr:tetratricopeptide repeat protein [Allosphingosinicella sp.]
MPEPFTASVIAANCAWAVVKSLSGKAGATAAMRAVEALRGRRTPDGNEVLAATHAAFVSSVQLMAEACGTTGGEAADQYSAKALANLAGDRTFTIFDPKAGAIPKKELDARIRAIFEGANPDPAVNAADAVIAELEQKMGEPLTEPLRALFRHGNDKHRSWPAAFELFFSEQVKTNERVFRILAFDRLNEVVGFAQTSAAELASLHATIGGFQSEMQQGFAESRERGVRMEDKLDVLLTEILAQRGAQIEQARIDPQAIVRIARKVSENVADAEQALAEIDVAIDDLLALRADAARGSNFDELVEAALQRIDARAAAGEFDAAAHEAAKAFAEWESREADRRERERATGIRFAEENIRTNRFRRDARAVAEWILRKAAVEDEPERDGFAALSAEIQALIQLGRDKGINFDLEVAVLLSKALQGIAQPGEKTASALVLKGDALQTLGERQKEGTALDEAVGAYRAALKIYVREQAPRAWALTHNNLGAALRTLGARQADTNTLDESVAAHRAALEVYTRETLPLDWAMTQNNLGNSLSELGERQEGTAALDQGIAAYRAALEIYSRERHPSQWSTTQNNLGTALEALGVRRGDPSTLELAIAAYRAALEVRTREGLPFPWAATQNNLGGALFRLGSLQEETDTLDQSVAAFRAALEVYTRDRLPLHWALTQNNLGAALRALGIRQDGTEMLDQAIDAYRASLEVRTRDRVALDWALTQENIGYALHAKAGKLGDSETSRAAVSAFEAALEVFAHPDLAWNRAKAERGLANAQALRDRLCGTE